MNVRTEEEYDESTGVLTITTTVDVTNTIKTISCPVTVRKSEE